MTYSDPSGETGTRCRYCSAVNPPGASICEACAAPLTAYETGGGLGPSAGTLAKLRQASEHPRIVPVIAVALVLWAVVGPFWTALAAFRAQPGASAAPEAYIFGAIGAVGVFLIALTMVPLGVFFLVTAWAAYRQQPWAWTAVTILLLLVGASGLLGLSYGVFAALIRIGVAGGLLYVWMQAETQEWYGRR